MRQDEAVTAGFLMKKSVNYGCSEPQRTDFGYAAEIWTHAKLTILLNQHLTPGFPRE